ncbi:tRNA (cytidine32/uridine32-2'-O)-methyltransferase [Marinospirillum celere]|uniref:tRNA (cytidine/uridine-2'-O-)-methyltransferase TrmJ n=1 Tax=Marinospirillum celere TaxID=1122252 RepID=A0A1I1DZ38_9GAMM|nr:RNA methyltransferase [Marinospirillum celere]SFB79696.1 tRNA (cytidine32/uridine32-2'-O)-methyltransferase [Marinospirillum celere]
MFPQVRIVLVQTFHPGNIGSAARAMKTMGLENLYLVNPVSFPDPEATQMAAGASDLLEKAQVCTSLEEAVADCSLIIGASARVRNQLLSELTPHQLGIQVCEESRQSEVALVFGRERTGLHNEELACCTHQVCIPGNPEYSILNLAQAVQVLCYEVFQASQQLPQTCEQEVRQYPSLEEIRGFEQHLEKALEASGMLRGASSKSLTRLNTLFRRARPDVQELGLLRSMVSRMEKQGLALQESQNKDH